ncbi:MAG: tetratricopeptide repeat protein [Candidatus Brocadiales bacterium]
MEAVTYPDANVTELINSRFVPLKLHVGKDIELVKRFDVLWTPTIVVAEADGTVHHRFTGFLPPEEYRAQLVFGIAKTDFDKGNYPEASTQFKTVVAQYPDCACAPEAQYWLGVSEFKRTGSADTMRAAWQELIEKYPDSVWATKASFIKDK